MRQLRLARTFHGVGERSAGGGAHVAGEQADNGRVKDSRLSSGLAKSLG